MAIMLSILNLNINKISFYCAILKLKHCNYPRFFFMLRPENALPRALVSLASFSALSPSYFFRAVSVAASAFISAILSLLRFSLPAISASREAQSSAISRHFSGLGLALPFSHAETVENATFKASAS